MALRIEENLKLQVVHQSQVGEARRICQQICKKHGFDEIKTEKAAIIITELGTNLVKHVQGERYILIQVFEYHEDDSITLDIISIDNGSGIENINKALGDGYSTSGTTGIGLGAVKRLSDEFEIYSIPDKGTIIFTRIYNMSNHLKTFAGSNTAFKKQSLFQIGQICLPISQETECGDAIAVYQEPERLVVMVADGLGHGEEAAHAAKTAVRIFTEHVKINSLKMVEKIHDGLRSTRGAAIGMAEILLTEQKLKFTGIGNISGRIINPGFVQNIISHNGIAGGECRKIQEFIYSWFPNSVLVMHSDGVSGRWDLQDYPGILNRNPFIIASIIYRDFHRSRDDTSVIVIKQNNISL